MQVHPPVWYPKQSYQQLLRLRDRSEERAQGFRTQKAVTFPARSEACSSEKRNKWRGPCAVKGRPDPVGGRNLPGKSCSTRKQSEREGLATVHHEAFDAKGPARPGSAST